MPSGIFGGKEPGNALRAFPFKFHSPRAHKKSLGFTTEDSFYGGRGGT